MKHILIDGTTISLRMDGLSQYILNVVSRLPLCTDRQYHIVIRPEECPEEYLSLWRKQGLDVQTARIAPIGPKREWQFRNWLRTQPAFDAAFIPSNQYPVALTIPSLYVVHDIIYERYPEQLGRWAAFKRWWLHRNVAKGLKQASKVIAVSRFTEQEILRFHPYTDRQKINVIYEGWEHLNAPQPDKQINIPLSDYILYIGSSRGHKNMHGLLNAMELAGDRIPNGKGLVIVGDNRMLTSRQHAQIKALHGKVITTGWLSQAELNAYCKRAKAIIFPSLCEGFGIPALEAFYFHKPLLVSNTSSLPEVAGDAGIYFEPTNPEQIAQAMIRALNMNSEEEVEWIQRGNKRLELFSWQKTADEINNLLNNILI